MIFEAAERFPGNMKKKKRIIFGPAASTEPSNLSYISSNFFLLLLLFLNSKNT